MAKYDVEHICGHTVTHQLFGKMKERERKLEWLKTTLCTECWTAEQREKRKKEPVTAEVIYNAYSDGVNLAVTTGDTYSIKDELKKAGCRYREYYANNDIFGLNGPRKAWMIGIDPNDVDGTAEKIRKLFDAGVTAIRDDTIHPLSATIAERIAKMNTKAQTP